MREREPKLHLQKKLVKSVANLYSKWRNLNIIGKSSTFHNFATSLNDRGYVHNCARGK